MSEEIKGTITDIDALIGVCKRLEDAKLLAFDFETTGLNIIEDVPVGISLASDNGVVVYIPFIHNGVSCLDIGLVMSHLKPIFIKDGIIIIAHNFVFDIQFLWKDCDIDIGWKFDEGLAADTQIMSWLDNENRDSHGLKQLAKAILKINMTNFDDLTKGTKFIDLPIDTAAKYGMLDSLATLQLFKVFLERLERQNLLDVFWKVEMPYTKVLALMKRRGVYVNTDLLDIYELRIDKELGELTGRLTELAGKEININSGDQLGRLLFSNPPDGFGAPIHGYTAGGKKPRKDGTIAPPKPKTDKGVIAFLASHDGMPWQEFCKVLIRYKALAKINSTYIKGLRQLINSDGKVRCNFFQTGTVTGRLSSSDPNLQNQPSGSIWVDKYYIGKSYSKEELYSLVYKEDAPFVVPDNIEAVKKIFPYHVVEDKDPDKKQIFEDENGRYFRVHRKIRDIYYNPNGMLLVADYSQMEMRLMAHFSKDKGLMKAFEQKKDIHTWVAALSRGISEEEVTKELRNKAKSVGFGTIYGKTVYGFATDWYSNNPDFISGHDKYGNPKIADKYMNLAQEFLNDFFDAFPGVKEYMDYTEAYCKKFGFIKTLTGRRRRLPAIYSDKKFMQEKAKRQATNTKIQGSAGDYIKMAQIELERELGELGVEQVIQVHDELVFNVPSEVGEKYIGKVKEIMENVVPLRVEIVTEPALVMSWGQAK